MSKSDDRHLHRYCKDPSTLAFVGCTLNSHWIRMLVDAHWMSIACVHVSKLANKFVQEIMGRVHCVTGRVRCVSRVLLPMWTMTIVLETLFITAVFLYMCIYTHRIQRRKEMWEVQRRWEERRNLCFYLQCVVRWKWNLTRQRIRPYSTFYPCTCIEDC